MHSEATAAFSSGEISPDDCDAATPAATSLPPRVANVECRPDARSISADNEHLARIMDPWSWLPASAWEDPEIRAYVPYEYLVAFEAVGETVDVGQRRNDNGPAHRCAAGSGGAPHRHQVWESGGGGKHVAFSATFTIDDARALAAALDEAGLEQDGLLNAYRLDYQFEYPDERLDPPMHIWFYAQPSGLRTLHDGRSCPWSLPMLANPADIAAPDGTASPDTTADVETTAPDDTPVAD